MNSFERGLLHYLSKDQLRRIQKIKIGIGGAGGLGSNAALALTRSGFKHFEILDHDRVETSNLNRQQYFLNDLGKPKVARLKKLLLKINPAADIRVHAQKWTVSTAARFFAGCDFVIEAFDQPEWKCAFVEYYQDRARFVVSGNGLAGVSFKDPLKIKKMGKVYFVGDMKTAASKENPPMAPRVMACAATMAGVVLELTLTKTQ